MIPEIINKFEREHGLVDQALADMITEELSRRELAPTSLARNTLYYWRTAVYKPPALMLEWLRDHAVDERLRLLAGEVLGAMALSEANVMAEGTTE